MNTIAPRVVGDFALGEVLGEGGFGTVYRARQISLDRDAVVKVMRRSLAANRAASERFILEAKLASRFEHPYAAHVYAFGEEADGQLWIAMERVRGTPLSQLVEIGPILADRFMPLFDRLCEVVQAAHDQGIVHRDIKPHNVMVEERAGRLSPKLLDFGIAKAVGVPVLDEPGHVVGSPQYISPEQWRDPASAGPRSDQYALALLAYETLTGEAPIRGRTTGELRDRHLAGGLPRHAALPLPVYAVLLRAAATEPEDRYASLHDLAAALRTAIAPSEDSIGRPDSIIAWAADAPRPIADAMTAIVNARSAIRIADRVDDAAGTLARWLGVLALACRSQQGALAVELVRALRRRTLRDEEWLGFLDGVTAPIAELAGSAEVMRPLFAPLALDDHSAAIAKLARLATALDALAWLLDYEVAAGREIWMGPTGEQPVMRDAPDDRVVVRDPDGANIVALTPLAQVHEGRMFLLAGPGSGDTARLTASPREREVDDVWPWLGLALAGDDARSPYPGLTAFTAADRAAFVGREPEIEAVVERLRAEQLIAIVGASGVGKSSFLVAGVAPALPATWRTIVVRPGRDPLAALAAMAGSPYRDGDATSIGELTSETICVIVDQGEELFTMCTDPAARAAFVEALTAPHLRVAIGVRDDFFVRVDEMFGGRLARALHVLRVPGEAELARMVELPATQRGYAFEDLALPREIAGEVAGRPGALPLLAFACAELWRRRDRHFHRITRASYDEIGGVAGALVRHADGIVDALPAAEQRLVRIAFRRLLSPEGTRALVATVDLDARIVEKLLAARLIATRDDEHVEIAHEALTAAWPRLVQWRREDDADARLHARIAAAAKHWHERNRDTGLLWRGEALAELHAWTGDGETAIERAFVDASARSSRRARRWRVAALAGAFVAVSIGAAVFFALSQTNAAQKREAIARLAASLEDRGRLAMLDDDTARGLVYLSEARKLGADDQALDILTNRALDTLTARAEVSREQADGVSGPRDTSSRLFYSEDNDHRAWDAATIARHTKVANQTWRGVVAATRIFTLGEGGAVSAYDRDGVIQWSVKGAHPDLSITYLAAALAVGNVGFTGTARGKLWNLETGALRGEIASDAPLSAATLSRDGSLLAIGDRNGAVRVFDGSTAAPVARCNGHHAAVHALVFTDAGRLASAGDDGRIAICDPRTGAELRVFQGTRQTVSQLVTHGRYLVSGEADGALRLWDLESGDERDLSGHHASLWTLAFSHDGARLATGGMDDATRIWDVASGLMLAALVNTSGTREVTWSNDDRTLTTRDGDGTIRRWEVARVVRGTIAAPLSGAPNVYGFVPGGDRLFLRHGSDGALVDTTTLAATELPGARMAAFAPNGDAWVVTDDHRIEIRDRAGALVRSLPGVWEWVSATPAAVAVLTRDNALSLPGGRPVTVPSTTLRLTSAGRWMIALPDWTEKTGPDPAIAADLATGVATNLMGKTTPTDVAVGRDELALSDTDDIVTFALADLSPRARLVGHQNVTALAYLPDGRLISAGDDHHVIVWRDGRQLASMTNVGGRVATIVVAADGKTFATASSDGALRVWDAEKYEALLVQPTSRGAALLATYRDDAVIVVGEDDRFARWKLDRTKPSQSVIDRVLRCRVPYRLEGDVLVPRPVERCE